MTNAHSDRTHISIVLDRTGSMQSIRQDTIGGFNAFLTEQKVQPNPASLTLVQFDTQDPYEVLYKFTPISQVQPLTEATYVPRASTPLYDAVGRGINDLKAALQAMPATERPARIVFVLVTDGQENSSREFTGTQVKQMIRDCRKDGWQFVFLSADESAIRDGGDMGFQADYSMAVPKHARGARHMWQSMSTRTREFRSMVAPDMSLKDLKDAAQGDQAE